MRLILMMLVGLSLPWLLSACGGNGPTPGSTILVSNSVGLTSNASGGNVMNVVVDGGVPSLIQHNGGYPVYIDGLFTSVQVCVPGTSSCQTIDHVLVDTGSVGLRLLSSQAQGELSLPLPAVNDGTAALYECTQFADGYSWGSVNSADVHLGGETAGNVPIQIIGVNTAWIPNTCSNNSINNTEEDNLNGLQANGILGIGVFTQDCGQNGCTPNPYYDCTNTSCLVPTQVPVQQVSNPVSLLAQDNNGVLIRLPGLTALGASTSSGQMLLGVNTEADNTLASSAHVLQLDPAMGQLNPTASATGLGNSSGNGNGIFSTAYTDSGTSVYEFGQTYSALPACASSSPGTGFSCPAQTVTSTVTLTGYGSSISAQTQVLLANASTLFVNANYAAFNDLVAPGPNDQTMVLGLPFFFGRDIASVISGSPLTQAGQTYIGPLIAF